MAKPARSHSEFPAGIAPAHSTDACNGATILHGEYPHTSLRLAARQTQSRCAASSAT